MISWDIDILALTETWLDSAIDDHVISELVPRGYGFHAVSRPGGQRGGVVHIQPDIEDDVNSRKLVILTTAITI